MKEQVLTVEQMQELINMGIDISKASMCWIGCSDGNDVYPYNSTFKDIFENHRETIPTVLTPTFTLQDILEIIISMEDNCSIDMEYPCRVALKVYNSEHNGEVCSFGAFGFDSSLINSAFEVLKWCKENNYI